MPFITQTYPHHAQALREEREALAAEKERVEEVFSDSQQVVLSVGGHRYTTTVATLRNAPAPSLFSAMFSGRHTLHTDDTGAYFIDRDGRHFHDVLNYLRDGTLSYHPIEAGDFKYLLELRSEAEFYGLIGLVDLIDRYPYAVTTVHRASTINTEDSWVYEDGSDEIVVSVNKPCQLLGVGLCGECFFLFFPSFLLRFYRFKDYKLKKIDLVNKPCQLLGVELCGECCESRRGEKWGVHEEPSY
jgi:hypothetical protein